MTRDQLPDEFTSADIAEQFNVENDLPETTDEVQLALVEALDGMDALMGDDPTKYRAMQALAKAFAGLDALEEAESEVRFEQARFHFSRSER